VEVQSGIELISDFIRTILASTGNIINDVSWSTVVEEVRHVIATILARWSGESLKFGGCADNWTIVEFSDNHSANETSEGHKLVEPNSPELGDCCFWDGYTTQQRKYDLA
jgi:hypothetical protein